MEVTRSLTRKEILDRKRWQTIMEAFGSVFYDHGGGEDQEAMGVSFEVKKRNFTTDRSTCFDARSKCYRLEVRMEVISLWASKDVGY